MTNVNNAFAPFMTHWGKGGAGAKHLGPKPSEQHLTTALAFSKHQKPGKETFALAMAMRDAGVTAGQIQIACGAPQNNHRRGLITEGLFKRDMTVPNTEQGHTVYKITLTAKGEAAIKRREAAAAKATVDGGTADKPAKVKKAKASKPRTRKAKVVPVSEPAPVAPEAPASDPQGEAGNVDGAQA